MIPHQDAVSAQIAYRDYAAFIAHIDAEHFFRTRQDGGQGGILTPFTKGNDIFTGECADYRRHINGSLGRFAGTKKAQVVPSVGEFLYNPASFVTFGNSDNVAIVAMDDFDLPTLLTSSAVLQVKQTCLAFCPKLASLGLDGVRVDGTPIFCELSDVCNGEPSQRDSQGSILAPRHPFLRERPLMAVSYYKLNGMAVLGPGLLFQQAAFVAMAKKIEETLQTLLSQARAQDNPLADISISEKDIKSFRCVFLDPQGWSDVVTLMFCTNYSVIATVLLALSSTTFDDLYAGDPTPGGALVEAVGSFSIHKSMAGIFDHITCAKQASDRLLRKNHAFASTFSTMGISHEAFEKSIPGDIEDSYRGIVVADTNLDVDPGHIADAAEAARRKLPVKPCRLEKEYLWYTVGHNDSTYRQLQGEAHDADNAIEVKDLMFQLKGIRDCGPEGAGKEPAYLSPHVLKTSTELHIPVPISVGSTKPPTGVHLGPIGERHIDTGLVLEELRARLFRKKSDRSSFNLDDLRDSIRKIRLPVPLSTSLVFLYSDFAKCLSDPLLFDSVIDLYDIFTAVYQLVTKELPESLKNELRRSRPEGRPLQDVTELAANDEKEKQLESRLDAVCRAFLRETDIDSMVRIVDLLHNALAHRSQVTFREVERWTGTVDNRGDGLERLLNASDAILKLGLGVLRRVLNDEAALFDQCRTPSQIDRDSRMRIGGASNISYNPRSISERLSVGSDSKIYLASVDLNIAHLFRPRALSVYFHEAGHLICEALKDIHRRENHCEYPCGKSVFPCHKNRHEPRDLRNSLIHERYEEIFAEMFVHQFIFGNDSTLYYRHCLANYSLNPLAYCKRDRDAILRMFEMCVRGFLTTDPFMCSNSESQADIYSGKKDPKVIWPEAYKRFTQVLADAGPFFFEFERLYSKQNTRKDFEDYFAMVYVEAYHPVCCIWKDIQALYGKIEPDLLQQEGIDLQCQVREAMENGTPLIRLLYQDAKTTGTREDAHKGRMDPLFLLKHVLKEHIAISYGAASEKNHDNLEVLLARDPKTGAPVADRLGDGKQWNMSLIDRTFNDLFTVHPDMRAAYMRSRIVLIKTLWDVSANLRARRMRFALEAAWPDLCQGD